MQTLKLNDTGSDVMVLQGYLGLTQDGIFGVITEGAVKSIQKEYGLMVDGIVGHKTWDALTSKDSIRIIQKPLKVHITKKQERAIKYIVIHFTGSSTSKQGRAQSTYNTFNSRAASADFCIDDVEIVQFNPDIANYYCWSVGDKKRNNNGGSLNKVAFNNNSISIELCSTCIPSTKIAVNTDNHEGWSFTDAVLDNAVKLTKHLMQKYNIPIDRVVRHYDITGKLCPGLIGWNNEPIYTVDGQKTNKQNNSDKWNEFKSRLV